MSNRVRTGWTAMAMLFLATATIANAQDRGCVELKTVAEVEQQYTNEQGQPATRLVPSGICRAAYSASGGNPDLSGRTPAARLPPGGAPSSSPAPSAPHASAASAASSSGPRTWRTPRSFNHCRLSGA